MHTVSDQNWTVEAWERDGGGGVGERWWWRRGRETVVEAWEGDSGYMLVGKKIE